MKVKVTYTPGDEQPTNLESNLKVELNYSQAPNGYEPPVKGPTMGGITVPLASDGSDGLYEDEYEEGRYIYRGSNPNNYITFNNETWRIIAKETDGTYKILRNELLPEERPFDTKGYRDRESNGAGGTFCANSSYGCNVWSSTANMVGSPAEFSNEAYTGTVLLDSSLNTYLNGEYLSSISANTDKIVTHTWNIGSVAVDNEDLKEQISGEKVYQWNGKIGLISHSDYIRANSNQSLCGTDKTNYENYGTCRDLDWMYIPGEWWWSLSPDADSSNDVFGVDADGYLYGANADNSLGVRPALYLSSDITLSGSGTAGDPYRIN